MVRTNAELIRHAEATLPLCSAYQRAMNHILSPGGGTLRDRKVLDARRLDAIRSMRDQQPAGTPPWQHWREYRYTEESRIAYTMNAGA